MSRVKVGAVRRSSGLKAVASSALRHSRPMAESATGQII
jgi:hypothetical protein